MNSPFADRRNLPNLIGLNQVLNSYLQFKQSSKEKAILKNSYKKVPQLQLVQNLDTVFLSVIYSSGFATLQGYKRTLTEDGKYFDFSFNCDGKNIIKVAIGKEHHPAKLW